MRAAVATARRPGGTATGEVGERSHAPALARRRSAARRRASGRAAPVWRVADWLRAAAPSRQLMTIRVLGVDACRAGWVAVELIDGAFAGASVDLSLAALLASAGPEMAAVGLDMPLGLLSTGWRDADEHAARFVGARRSSVFRVPPGPVWELSGYAEANAACRELTGAGFSRQAYGLRHKLREANGICDSHRLHEVHPEVSFRAMAGADVAYPKHSWAGQARCGGGMERASDRDGFRGVAARSAAAQRAGSGAGDLVLNQGTSAGFRHGRGCAGSADPSARKTSPAASSRRVRALRIRSALAATP